MKKACRRLGVTRWPYSRQRPRFDINSSSPPELSKDRAQASTRKLVDDEPSPEIELNVKTAPDAEDQEDEELDNDSSSEWSRTDADNSTMRTESWSSQESNENDIAEGLKDFEEVPLEQSFIKWFVEDDIMDDAL